MRLSLQMRLRLLLLLPALVGGLHAQTLARPGWEGSGLSAEPWWRSAIFYRIAPEGFQDSDGDGLGDLRGIAQRMDYLQSVGADALVLETPFSDNGFDDLMSEASRRHIRLLVAVSSSDAASVVPMARQWLTRGVAGVWLRVAHGETAEHTVAMVHSLRTLADSYPGQRVLVEDTTADPAMWPAAGAELVAKPLPAVAAGAGDAVSLRLSLAQAQSVPAGSAPLLVLTATNSAHPRTADQDKVLAAALLASRTAVAVDYGQEIGLPAASIETTARVMQWTPSNITQRVAVPAAATPVEAPKPAPRQDVYGAFVPYVPPARPVVPTAIDKLNMLQGFTTSTLPQVSNPDTAARNVAAEDADADSVLAFYRKLAQLHHDHPAVRSGTSYPLDHDAQDALVWVLRVPANARTSSTVIAACNLSGQRVVLPLHADLNRLGIRFAELRVLLTSVRSNAQADQTTESVTLAPWSVFVAELDH
ncbi:MAG TPA: hypothetical protein VGN16_20780 [Acidobacteriaceae bacterium]|jgi:alpha-glucosidase